MLSSPRFLLKFVFLILLSHFIALYFGLYSSIWWFDIPMHFFGGMWVSLLFFYVFKDVLDKDSFYSVFGIIKVVIMAVAFSALVGVLWEFFEFAMSKILDIYLQGDLTDTMTDFLMDISGGLVAGIIGLTSVRKNNIKED